MSGSFATLAGSGVSQFLRFLSNLALTQLLMPEAFGLMTLVTTFMQGLRMFSDFGIGPSVIQSPRGEEPTFLQTAWSLQVVRGWVLGGIAVLIAWPLSLYYEEPRLLTFVPIAGIQAIISGFNSTSLFLLQRRLLLVKRVQLEIGAQIFGIVVMITWALISKTPWALLGGGLAETACVLVASHLVQPRQQHHFKIDRDEAHRMLRFGRWVFIATAFTFFATKIDRLVLGKAFNGVMTELGIYNVAIVLSSLLVETMRDLASRVLFPLFARWSIDDREELRHRILRTRIVFGVATTIPMALLALAGPWLIEHLYKKEYWGAGPMLRLLSAGAIGGCCVATMEPALLALGDSFRHMFWQAGRFAITLSCALFGLAHGGSHGFVMGMAWSNLAVVPLLALLVRAHGLLTPWFDVVIVAISGALLLYVR